MKITRDQVDYIRSVIAASDVSSRTLRDDLLDHLCCVVESKLTSGADFDLAFREAMDELAPQGLDDIQQRSYIMLHSPRILLMKKVTYSIGLISACAISMGWMFFLFHWPGAYELFNYGSMVFMLLFVPLLTASRMKNKVQTMWWQRLCTITGVISSLSVGMSIVFKFGHLQGADYLLLCGVLLFTGCFLPLLFFSLYRNELAKAS